MVNAVDTREDGFKFKNFNLKIDPPNKIARIEFSKNKGVVGCYLSHYKIWKHIVANKIKYALVLEDDASIKDVNRVLDKGLIQKMLSTNEPTLIQLNKRTTVDKLPYWFDGTESYAVNKQEARYF